MKTLGVVRRVGGVVVSEFVLHQAQPPSVPPPPPLPEPTVAQMLGNFAGAMVEWVKRGAPVVPEATYQARLIACRSCPGHHWDEAARMGAGKCSHPSCGCTKAKLWLGTSTCPIKHWPA